MNVILTPRVNIVRDPVADIQGSNGGNYQTYGEDPVLNGRLGAAEAVGIQRDGNCIACLKQMFGSSTGTAQGSPVCLIEEQAMHEIYMQVFEEPIRAGVGSAMTNYNQVNGKWTSMASEMNQTLCRTEWGFKGFIVDDWHCLFNPASIMENVTLEMPGKDYVGEGSEKSVYGRMLMVAIADPDSPITEEHLNKAVGRLLTTLHRFDMLDNQRIPGPLSPEIKEQGIRDARDIATKIAVLLKNEDSVLPLDIKRDKVALIGPTARQTAMPVFKEASYGFPDRKTGPLQALRHQMAQDVTFAVGNDLEGVLVPAKNLKTHASGAGLTRHIVELPDNGSHTGLDESLPFVDGTIGGATITDASIVDATVNFSGDTDLPPLEMRYQDTTVVPFYLWQGRLVADETGYHRLSLQTYTPGAAEYKQNIRLGREMEILTSGNLYIRESGAYRCLGTGYRVLMNGGAAANSSVVPCMDGWNNVGGYVYMEAGREYDIFLTACSVYKMPVGVRLCWVTPAMVRANIQQAVEAARQADKAIVFAWHISPSTVLELDECQNALIEAVTKANPNTVVVLNNGDPVAMPWRDRVKGILEMWYPGQEGGCATADVLTGRANPGGKLPVTFPRQLEDTAPHAPGHPERCGRQKRLWTSEYPELYISKFTEGVHMGYRWLDENNIEPMFAFGFGLSYTSFAYDHLAVQRSRHGLSVTVGVKNTGKRFGAEIVQCYLHRPDQLPAGVQASPIALAAFARVELEPGEEKCATLLVNEKSLSYYHAGHKCWELFAGERKISVGASSRNLLLSAKVFV